jgi:hypothetical protein
MRGDASVVGEVINFRAMIYGPVNEQGVVCLFATMAEDLNLRVEEIRSGYPDCIARRFTGRGYERVRIEFEYASRAFLMHGHDPSQCDIVVCWVDDWPGCPLEVIELSRLVEAEPGRVAPGAWREVSPTVERDALVLLSRLGSRVLALEDRPTLIEHVDAAGLAGEPSARIAALV